MVELLHIRTLTYSPKMFKVFVVITFGVNIAQTISVQ